MVEYVLLLTISTGRSWLGGLTTTFAADPVMAGGVLAAVLLGGYVLLRRA